MTTVALTGPAAAAIQHVIVSAQRPEPLIGHDTFASLVGAFLGGLMAMAVQWWSSNRQEAAQKRAHQIEVGERETERRARDIGTAFGLIAKVGRAYTTVQRLHDHLHEGRIAALRSRKSLVGAVRPTLSDEVKTTFTESELSLIQRSCSSELIGRLLNLPHLQAQYIDFMATYRSERSRIPDLMSRNEIEPDGSYQTVFEGVNAHRVELLERELGELLNLFLLWSHHDRGFASNVLFDLNEVFANRFSRQDMRFGILLKRLPDLPNPRDNPTRWRAPEPKPPSGRRSKLRPLA